MTGLRVAWPASTTTLPPRNARLLMGWRHAVSTHHDQLTHAVVPGDTSAQCGVIISVVGAAWPEPGAGTPLSRCSICAQAVEGMWRGVGSRADER